MLCYKFVILFFFIQYQVTSMQKKIELNDSLTATQSPLPRDIGSKTVCIVCKRPARASSIYCSDSCILKHAQDSLGNQTSPNKSDMDPGKSQEKQKSDSRVSSFLNAFYFVFNKNILTPIGTTN